MTLLETRGMWLRLEMCLKLKLLALAATAKCHFLKRHWNPVMCPLQDPVAEEKMTGAVGPEEVLITRVAALATVDNLPEKAKNMLQTRPASEPAADLVVFHEAVQDILPNAMAIQILVERTDTELTDLMTGYQLSAIVLNRLSAPDRASLLDISDHRVPTLANWFEFICQRIDKAYISMEPLRCDDQGDFVQGEANRITRAYREVYGLVLGVV